MRESTRKLWRSKRARLVVLVVSLVPTLKVIGCNGLFYWPDRQVYSSIAQHAASHEELYFSSLDGTRLHGWLLRASSRARATIVYFHGNAANLSGHVSFVSWLPAHGYHVFIFDYRQYGKSAGRASRAGLHQDGIAALRYIRGRKDLTPDRLIVVGQSLGGACALDALGHDSRAGVRGLVIISSFLRYRQVANDMLGGTIATYPAVWLLISETHSPETSIGRLRELPLLVLHGDADRTVPLSNGQAIMASAPGPRRIVVLAGVGHNEMLTAATPRARDELLRFLSTHGRP